MSNESDLLKAHVEKVKDRLEAQDLSTMELRLQVDETRARTQDESLSSTAREMAKAEYLMVNGLLTEQLPEPATPAELVTKMKESGDAAGAAHLEHGIKIAAALEAAKEAHGKLLMNEDGSKSAKLEADYKALQQTADEMSATQSPTHIKQVEAQTALIEARDLRANAAGLRDGDPARERQADRMDAQADEIAPPAAA